jgi:hypothetical protein
VRMLLGLLFTLLMFVGPVGDRHSLDDSREAAASQTPPSTAKCEIQDARDCSLSKQRPEFILWKAPANEQRNVCFDAPYPFASQNFHIDPGSSTPSGPIVIQPPPKKGTEFKYRTGKNPCPNPDSETKIRNHAKVIVED